jgi:hypothetical protein
MSNTVMIMGNVDHTHLPISPGQFWGGVQAGDSVLTGKSHEREI